jgi:hypothetical protein
MFRGAGPFLLQLALSVDFRWLYPTMLFCCSGLTINWTALGLMTSEAGQYAQSSAIIEEPVVIVSS